jgi:pimeloyl-ACP methyl ester carboxylesterase
LLVIANAAHHLPNEQPAETNSAIESFLSEL